MNLTGFNSLPKTQQIIMENSVILKQRESEFNNKKGPRVGDFLKLPYGLYTRFTYDWGDKIQTGGMGGSYYLGNGYCSHSGGLDAGVKRSDIKLTTETKEGSVWFFNQGIAGAGRGVHFNIQFRIFEPIPGADLSGCWEIAAYEKAEFLKTVDTITRVNGNGQEYTLPLPEVVIQKFGFNPEKLEILTGLKFTVKWGAYAVQPIKKEQFAKIIGYMDFRQEFHHNGTIQNTLYLK